MKTIFDVNEQIASSLHFSAGLWLLIAAILFALLCLCFLLTVRNGRVKPRSVLIEFGWLSLAYFSLYGLGFLTCDSFLFNEALWKPRMPVLFISIASVVILFVCCLYFFKRKKRFADRVSATAIRRSAAGSGAAKYAYALLFAGMLLSSILCGIRFGCGDSFVHLLVPMATVALVLLLYLLTHWNFWYLVGGVLLLACALLGIQAELVETQFAFAPLLALIPLYLSSILPLLFLGTQRR